MTSSEPSENPEGEAPRSEKHSLLEAAHVALGAKMVPFGGWLMPLSYPDGTLAEHRECRTNAVAFDVSHLGTVRVVGDDAFNLLQHELSNDLRKVAPGRAQYTHLLDESDASVTDDIIVWWIEDDVFDVMPNASNTSRVLAAIGGEDTTSDRVVVAVQGPRARALLQSVSPDAASVGHFAVSRFEFSGVPCTVAGTGYTGEDGVECSVPAEVAEEFWQAVLGAGIKPAGLGARDTLRLETGLPLHGHELGPGITPLQAGLGWVVGWEKDHFRGKAPLEEERRVGPRRKLRALVSESRRPPREGNEITSGAATVGFVTSGNFSPILGRGIALCLIDQSAELKSGETVTVRVGSGELPARLTKAPFVKDGKPTDELALD